MITNGNKKGLGRAIQVMRESKELSVEELAHRSGVKPENLEAIETGNKTASLLQLHSLARALNSSLLRLMEKSLEYKD